MRKRPRNARTAESSLIVHIWMKMNTYVKSVRIGGTWQKNILVREEGSKCLLK